MWPGLHTIYTTSQGVTVYASKGGKSQYNLKIVYREPGKRVRTPKHIHLIVDLYLKQAGNPTLTMQLVEHIIQEIISKVQPSTSNPPSLQVFSLDRVKDFQQLEAYGEYSVEFLLVITELILIQEKTNFPSGRLSLKLYKLFRDGADIFSVVGAASFTGKKA